MARIGTPGRKLRPPRWSWPLLGIGLLVLLLALGGVIAGPMVRDRLVREANQRLVGYSLQVGSAAVYPWNLELLLRDVTVRQDAHPEPAVAHVPRMDVELQWLALLRGRIVAVTHFDSPVVNINVAQLAAEAQGDVDFRQRGWQRLPELYPLEVNDLQIRNATLSYTARDAERPLQLSEVALEIRNIRHVAHQAERFPSPLKATAVVFNDGRASFNGAADFLSYAHPAFQGSVEISAVPLATLGPILRGYPLTVEGGVLAAQGEVQSDPSGTLARLAHVRVTDMRADYLGGSAPAVVQAGRRAVAAAGRAAHAPQFRLELADLQVSGEFGYRNQAHKPGYRLFLSDASLSVQDTDNQDPEVKSTFALAGLFMGSGHTQVQGAFRSGTGQADFALDMRMLDAPLVDLNDALRSHLHLDVSRGNVSVYSQLLVKGGRVNGYVKPLFKDVKIYGPQDADKGIMHKLFEHVADGVRKVLQNHQSHDVATVVDLSGPVSRPDASTLQVIGKLLENAFIKAILPGLDREIKATGRRVVRVPADQSGARSDDAGTPVERAQQRRERQGRKLLVVDHGLLLEPPGPKAQTSLFCARAAVGLQAGPL